MEKLEILLNLLFSIVVLLFINHSAIAMENLALRQQLSLYQHSKKRPRIRLRDRLFWILVSRYWKKWKDALIIVKPETVIGRHRKGFRLFWSWKSRRRRPGRSKISIEIRNLIKTMANENPTWGAPRIHGELLALGKVVSSYDDIRRAAGEERDFPKLDRIVLLMAWKYEKIAVKCS